MSREKIHRWEIKKRSNIATQARKVENKNQQNDIEVLKNSNKSITIQSRADVSVGIFSSTFKLTFWSFTDLIRTHDASTKLGQRERSTSTDLLLKRFLCQFKVGSFGWSMVRPFFILWFGRASWASQLRRNFLSVWFQSCGVSARIETGPRLNCY